MAATLAEALKEQGIDVRLLREPGGVRTAEQIRELVKDPALTVGPRAEALLYAAARAQLVEELLEPVLRNGTWALLDRFVDSSLAYQGGGRELGIGAIRKINDFATGNLLPDRTLLLRIDPAEGRRRSRGRPEPPDRLELEDAEFHERIAAAYGELAAADPDRIRTLDAEQEPQKLLAAALDELADLI